MDLLDDVVKWKLASVSLEIVLISMQDRCTVCAKHAIGPKIVRYTRWNSKVTCVKWKFILVCLESVNRVAT
jgi:hypothetical protein